MANREKKVTQLGLSGNQEIGVLQLGPSEGSPQETKWKAVIGASGSLIIRWAHPSESDKLFGLALGSSGSKTSRAKFPYSDCLKPRPREGISLSQAGLTSEFQRCSCGLGALAIRVFPVTHLGLSLGTVSCGMSDEQKPSQGCASLHYSQESRSVKPFLFLQMAYPRKGLFSDCSIFVLCASEGKICFVFDQALKQYLSWRLPIFLSTWKV